MNDKKFIEANLSNNTYGKDEIVTRFTQFQGSDIELIELLVSNHAIWRSCQSLQDVEYVVNKLRPVNADALLNQLCVIKLPEYLEQIVNKVRSESDNEYFLQRVGIYSSYTKSISGKETLSGVEFDQSILHKLLSRVWQYDDDLYSEVLDSLGINGCQNEIYAILYGESNSSLEEVSGDLYADSINESIAQDINYKGRSASLHHIYNLSNRDWEFVYAILQRGIMLFLVKDERSLQSLLAKFAGNEGAEYAIYSQLNNELPTRIIQATDGQEVADLIKLYIKVNNKVLEWGDKNKQFFSFDQCPKFSLAELIVHASSFNEEHHFILSAADTAFMSKINSITQLERYLRNGKISYEGLLGMVVRPHFLIKLTNNISDIQRLCAIFPDDLQQSARDLICQARINLLLKEMTVTDENITEDKLNFYCQIQRMYELEPSSVAKENLSYADGKSPHEYILNHCWYESTHLYAVALKSFEYHMGDINSLDDLCALLKEKEIANDKLIYNLLRQDVLEKLVSSTNDCEELFDSLDDLGINSNVLKDVIYHQLFLTLPHRVVNSKNGQEKLTELLLSASKTVKEAEEAKFINFFRGGDDDFYMQQAAYNILFGLISKNIMEAYFNSPEKFKLLISAVGMKEDVSNIDKIEDVEAYFKDIKGLSSLVSLFKKRALLYSLLDSGKFLNNESLNGVQRFLKLYADDVQAQNLIIKYYEHQLLDNPSNISSSILSKRLTVLKVLINTRDQASSIYDKCKQWMFGGKVSMSVYKKFADCQMDRQAAKLLNWPSWLKWVMSEAGNLAVLALGLSAGIYFLPAIAAATSMTAMATKSALVFFRVTIGVGVLRLSKFVMNQLMYTNKNSVTDEKSGVFSKFYLLPLWMSGRGKGFKEQLITTALFPLLALPITAFLQYTVTVPFFAVYIGYLCSPAGMTSIGFAGGIFAVFKDQFRLVYNAVTSGFSKEKPPLRLAGAAKLKVSSEDVGKSSILSESIDESNISRGSSISKENKQVSADNLDNKTESAITL